MGNAVATKVTGAQELATFVENHMDQIAEATPLHVRAETIVRQIVATVRGNPELARCTKASLVDCLRKASLTGLEVSDGPTAQAHIIPYGKDAKFQISYKGYKELVRRGGQGTVAMESVHEGDVFEPRGSFALPMHHHGKDPQRRFTKLTHAFAAWIPKDGSAPVVSVWTREECIAHRDHYSRGYNGKKDSPWHEDNPAFRVMCMKTALLDLVNRGDLPLSSEVCEIARQEMHNYVDAVQQPALTTTSDDEAAAAAALSVTQQTPPVEDREVPTANDLAEYMREADDPDALACELMEKYPEIDGDIASARKHEVRQRNAAAEA